VPALVTEYVTVPVPLDVATALTVDPKSDVAVWEGGVAVPFVKVIVGVWPITVIVSVDEPAAKLPFALALAVSTQVPGDVNEAFPEAEVQPVEP
jgi:hypothetical protein